MDGDVGSQSTGGVATATTNSANSPDMQLILGDWYQFSIDITKSAAANTFLVSGALQDFGTDGLTAGTTTTLAPVTINSANTVEIYNDTTVFGAFRSHAGQGGADTLDNFSITQPVPEPASFGLLGLAAMALVSRRKRK